MRRDLAAGLAMTLIGAIIIFVLIPYGVVEPKKIKFAALSPSYYPRIVAIALLVLGLSVTVRSVVVKSGVDGLALGTHPNAFRRVSLIFTILIFYAVSVSWLGFILASSIILLAAFWLAGERRMLLMLPLAALLPLALYFFFLKIAGIPIPLGLLEPVLAGV